MNKNKLISITIIFFIFIFAFTLKSNAGTQRFNELDFTAKINYDGSIDVVETWDIYISQTNTLFKTFKTDSSKYTGITNVQVKEITSGKNLNFEEINSLMYHVTKNCFYGMKNNEGDFEIAWGVGLDSSSDTRKYQISYKVLDAVALYNDYAEFYWQFVGNEFSIPAKKVHGTITLPSPADKKEDIKVWGHVKTLNGEIYAIDNKTIDFTLNNYGGNEYIEIRSIFPKKIIERTGRIYSSNILDKAIKEETVWADEANALRTKQKMIKYIVIGGYCLLNIFILSVVFKKIRKYKDILNGKTKLYPTQELEYYRDFPYENATPGEACFVKNRRFYGFENVFGNIFAATILDLNLKKYIEINSTGKGKNDITLTFLDKPLDDLKDDEKKIFKYLASSFKYNNPTTLKEIEKYFRRHSTSLYELMNNTHNLVRKQMVEENIFDKKEEEENSTYTGYGIMYIVFFIILAPLTLPFSIYLGILSFRIAKRCNPLTQIGLDYEQMWKGLEKYMKDYSLLKDREVFDVVLWEKFLVFATAFGIADKVIKQLKIAYPNIEQMDTFTNSAYMSMMIHSDFSNTFNSAIASSVSASTAPSSGSGGGGGFSGGGGGGRRRTEVEEEDKPLLILKYIFLKESIF